MKTILTGLRTTLLLLLGWTLATAAPPASDEAPTDAAVRVIRAHYAEINAHASQYRQVKKELASFSSEGGALVASFRGDTLMKIVAIFYGESGEAIEEYYYWEGQLIFVYRADSDYVRPLSRKVVRTREDRFYFDGGKLIRWIDEHAKPVNPGNGTFADKQKECLQDSAEFVQAARSQKPVVEASR